MAKLLHYLGKTLDFPLADDKIVGDWQGPAERLPLDIPNALRQVLESPIDLPALGRCVVPGDRVTIAVDPRTPDLSASLAVMVNVLESAGVEREAIAILFMPHENSVEAPISLPAGIASSTHDPAEEESLGYLATTQSGRRIYLNKALVDADFVLAIGPITKDPILGWAGPWSTLYPGLSDVASRTNFTAKGKGTTAEYLVECAEVSWLLGNQFQVGLIPGAEGTTAVFAGLGNSVRIAGIYDAENTWTFRTDRRADLVVVGLGAGAGLDAAWNAFAMGAKLVRRGGKVVALSDAPGPIGPAARQLEGTENFAEATAALDEATASPDIGPARKLAEALAWADLYLLSELEESDVEDLGIVPLSKPSEARRLALAAVDVTLVSHAEWTTGIAQEDAS